MPPRTRARPGPLESYDLALFLPGTPSHPRPNKRSHSPSVGQLDGPTKRRLKDAGGARTPARVKSPLSGSSTGGRFAPALFHAMLQGPNTPAKRLDFGSSEATSTAAHESPRGVGGSGTPRRSPKSTASGPLRRSPRTSVHRSQAPSGSPAGPIDGQTGTEAASVAVRVSMSAPILIPRDVVPPDPQSVHYPGFVVYQDPHIALPSSSQLAAVALGEDHSTPDVEVNKENAAPPRPRTSKASKPGTPSDAAWLKAGLASPSSVGSSKIVVPPSPHPKHVQDYLATPRPIKTPKDRKLPSVAAAATGLAASTPARIALTPDDRKKMRLALEEEVDEGEGDDDQLA